MNLDDCRVASFSAALMVSVATIVPRKLCHSWLDATGVGVSCHFGAHSKQQVSMPPSSPPWLDTLHSMHNNAAISNFTCPLQ